MSRENVELVRTICEEWSRGDYSRTDWQHPDVEFAIADGPHPGQWIGAGGVAEGWGDFLGAWKDFRQVPDAYREIDEHRVLVLFHFSGQGKTSGVAVEQMGTTAAGVFDIRGGKIARLTLYFDHRAALEAVGLRE